MFEPTKEDWELTEILLDPARLFVLWAVKTGFCTSSSAFRAHFGPEFRVEQLIESLKLSGCLAVLADDVLELAVVGDRLVSQIRDTTRSQFAEVPSAEKDGNRCPRENRSFATETRVPKAPMPGDRESTMSSPPFRRAVMDQVLQWEERQSETLLDHVGTTLQNSGHTSEAALMKQAWKAATPALVQGRHLNPVHHTAHVVDAMVRILLGQASGSASEPEALSLTERDLALGIVAAVFHDAGNAFEPRDERKIRKQDVRDNPGLRPAAIAQRTRHMESGGVLVEVFMRTATPWNFTEQEIQKVRRLVEHHDDPTLAEFTDNNDEKKRHLFVPEPTDHPLADIYPLSAILREADRLWMLTVPGIVCDLMRNLSQGKPWHWEKQLKDNVENHRKDGKLYMTLFARATDWGLKEETAFYRSIVGKMDFQRLQDDTRKLKDADWIAQVTSP
jgi:hypothetical protein